MTIDDDDGGVRFEHWIRRVLASVDPQWLLASTTAGQALDDPVVGAVPPQPGHLLARAYTAQATRYRRQLRAGRKLRVLTMPDGRLTPLDPNSGRRNRWQP